ncbi:Platinum sensitivity protein [Dispira parvispora]|uniref:Platinum sensitivity protein n=1 Tax=Dispira parvispora TaxID=1520584 RepID=A0A9W8ATI5_9FUNG|nr:Platinum sensitivity protein [Dispira parvispora]
MTESNRLRVKLYELVDQRWMDKGTGYCSCVFIDSIKDHCIIVHSELDDSMLLSTPVQSDTQYQLQQDSLIVWRDTNGCDVALSFQTHQGCMDIWGQICDIQRNYRDQDNEPWRTLDTLELPTPTVGNLDKIIDLISQANVAPFRRDLLTAYIQKSDFIDQLIAVFETCEDLESTDDLHKLCRIMKFILIMANDAILEAILEDHRILPVVGMLEYDPEYHQAKANHRAYLSDRARFKEVVPITDPGVRQKIHQSFRLQYLKDTILARMLDDSIYQTISTKIFHHNMDIVVAVGGNHDLLAGLTNIIKDADAPEDQKRDVVYFIRQLCTMAKSFPYLVKTNLYRALGQNGLFSILEYALANRVQEDTSLVACELITSVLELDRVLVRSYIIAQSKQGHRPLLDLLLNHFRKDDAPTLQMQCYEIIRTLLDVQLGGNLDALQSALIEGCGGNSNSLGQNPPMDSETEQFLSLFYETYMGRTVEPLNNLTPDHVHQLHQTDHKDRVQLYLLICELVTFCVRQHTFRSRYFVLSGELVDNLALLLSAPVKHLQLAVLRFFRACIGLNDNFVNRYLLRRGVLKPIVTLFEQHKHRYNLINSACLEFFDFITSKNLKLLVTYFVQHHKEALTKDVHYSNIPSQLVQKYEVNQGNQRLLAQVHPPSRDGTDQPRVGNTPDSGTTMGSGEAGLGNSEASSSATGTGSPGLPKRHHLPRKGPRTAGGTYRAWGSASADYEDDEAAFFDATEELAELDETKPLDDNNTSIENTPQEPSGATDEKNTQTGTRFKPLSTGSQKREAPVDDFSFALNHRRPKVRIQFGRLSSRNVITLPAGSLGTSLVKNTDRQSLSNPATPTDTVAVNSTVPTTKGKEAGDDDNPVVESTRAASLSPTALRATIDRDSPELDFLSTRESGRKPYQETDDIDDSNDDLPAACSDPIEINHHDPGTQDGIEPPTHTNGIEHSESAAPSSPLNDTTDSRDSLSPVSSASPSSTVVKSPTKTLTADEEPTHGVQVTSESTESTFTTRIIPVVKVVPESADDAVEGGSFASTVGLDITRSLTPIPLTSQPSSPSST